MSRLAFFHLTFSLPSPTPPRPSTRWILRPAGRTVCRPSHPGGEAKTQRTQPFRPRLETLHFHRHLPGCTPLKSESPTCRPLIIQFRFISTQAREREVLVSTLVHGPISLMGKTAVGHDGFFHQILLQVDSAHRISRIEITRVQFQCALQRYRGRVWQSA